ncbi:UNVERIFIED_CONTAM: Glyoxysomal fatty acid beta-oxidation multifunctional protein MFP-a [Sesamum calycinum]|uniref:Glyoxysomal fatty acid beta-oxidation multifunctional protein MFP-a n=1 Tax=Sesamum calycinum TaxID=2727403 RepID=A0AAW2SFA8_9LAMI
MLGKTAVEVRADGVAVVTINNPPLNLLSVDGSRGKFSAGFNVTAFGGTQGKMTKMELGFMSIQIVTDTLEGTQRLPRLVGLSKALEMILMSKRVDGKEARILSLVDTIAPADKLLEVACQWALDIVERRRPWVISLYRTDKLESLAEARAILKSARLEAQRQNPNVVHPLVCIDVIEQGIVSSPRKALRKEAEALQELRQSSTCRSLVHVFFAQRQIFKIPVISKMNLLPRKIVKVAVVGGGLMSSEIATMLVLSNYQVILKETNKKHLIDAISIVKENLQNRVKNGRATQEGLEKSLSLLEGVLDYGKFKDVDLVIEAESESLSLKQEIFSNLEKCCPLHWHFTSNISQFGVEIGFGERTKSQHRLLGSTFLLSVRKFGLVMYNVIVGSSIQVNVVLTKLSDSEMVEMILFPALNEACRMISDGVVIRSSDLDVASVLGMGFPAYRGGIIYWSDSFGSKYICSRLEKWSKAYGGFFQPCNYIMERSAKNISLTSETRQAKSQL